MGATKATLATSKMEVLMSVNTKDSDAYLQGDWLVVLGSVKQYIINNKRSINNNKTIKILLLVVNMSIMVIVTIKYPGLKVALDILMEIMNILIKSLHIVRNQKYYKNKYQKKNKKQLNSKLSQE